MATVAVDRRTREPYFRASGTECRRSRRSGLLFRAAAPRTSRRPSLVPRGSVPAPRMRAFPWSGSPRQYQRVQEGHRIRRSTAARQKDRADSGRRLVNSWLTSHLNVPIRGNDVAAKGPHPDALVLRVKPYGNPPATMPSRSASPRNDHLGVAALGTSARKTPMSRCSAYSISDTGANRISGPTKYVMALKGYLSTSRRRLRSVDRPVVQR